MGMFDYIKCEMDLPDGNQELKEMEFQTKSLECGLDMYIITKGGKLVLKSKNRNKIIDYHGDISFYTFIDKGKSLKWHKYIARFNNGKIQYIKKTK